MYTEDNMLRQLDELSTRPTERDTQPYETLENLNISKRPIKEPQVT